MEAAIVSRAAFAVLGVEGRGPASSGHEWIPPLWEAARARYGEVQGLVTGGSWGLMSAVDKPYARWGSEGKYLAGYEVGWNTEAPKGWTLWKVPDTTFVAVACTMATYGEAWQYFHKEFAEHPEYEQAGAVHEYYPVDFRDPDKDTLYLYFTVRRKASQ